MKVLTDFIYRQGFRNLVLLGINIKKKLNLNKNIVQHLSKLVMNLLIISILKLSEVVKLSFSVCCMTIGNSFSGLIQFVLLFLFVFDVA